MSLYCTSALYTFSHTVSTNQSPGDAKEHYLEESLGGELLDEEAVLWEQTGVVHTHAKVEEPTELGADGGVEPEPLELGMCNRL